MNYISHFQYFTGFLTFPYIYNIRVVFCLENEKMQKSEIFFAKRFGSLKFVRTFAIPKQSGGGEMVDTLL